MRLPPEDPPTGEQDIDDPFAEFPVEAPTGPAPPPNHDWFTEFADEKAEPPAEGSKTWRRLSESVKDENGQS